MSLELTALERKMLLEACEMLRQADLDTIPDTDDDEFAACNYGIIDKKLIERWDALIAKIKQTRPRRAK